MMGKYDGWYTAEQIEKDGIANHSTINHYCSSGEIDLEHKVKENNHWKVSPDIYDALKKAKSKHINLLYAIHHREEIKALPDDCYSMIDAANDLQYHVVTLYKYFNTYEVPGVIYVNTQKLLRKELFDKCQNARNLEYLLSQLDITNTDAEAIKFRQQFEVELETPAKILELKASESMPNPEQHEVSEFIPSIDTNVFYRQGHKFKFEDINASEIIDQIKRNIKILKGIAEDRSMSMLSTFCDQTSEKLNSIHLQTRVIDNYTYTLEYIDDDPNPVVFSSRKQSGEGAVA